MAKIVYVLTSVDVGHRHCVAVVDRYLWGMTSRDKGHAHRIEDGQVLPAGRPLHTHRLTETPCAERRP